MLRDSIEATQALFRPYLYAAAAQIKTTLTRSRLVSYNLGLLDIVKASAPLMQTARQCISRDGPDEKVVSAYLDRHIEEERGHDRWIEEDLEDLGYNWRSHGSCSVSAARLVGEAYYQVMHISPFSILGYIAAIECNPPSASFVSALAITEDRKGFKAIKEHADIDPHHSSEIMALFERLRLAKADEDAIGYSLKRAMTNSIEFLVEIAQPELFTDNRGR